MKWIVLVFFISKKELLKCEPTVLIFYIVFNSKTRAFSALPALKKKVPKLSFTKKKEISEIQFLVKFLFIPTYALVFKLH